MHRHMRIHKKDDAAAEPSLASTAASPRLRTTKHKLGDDNDVKIRTDVEHIDKKRCLDSGDVKAIVKVETMESTVLAPPAMTKVDATPEVKVKFKFQIHLLFISTL